MKKLFQLTFILGSFLAVIVLTSCAYGGVTNVGKDHVVVLRNDAFLFGAIRRAYVCRATPGGLENCRYAENP